MKPLVVDIEDLKLLAGPNSRGHWRKKASRVKREREAAHWTLLDAKRPPLPVVVRLVRIAPRSLDDDNLQGVFKAIRDGVADAYGIDDKDRSRIRFEYDQERGAPHQYGVRIEVRPA
ncbi:endodeoxyribonuclease RusA [Luteibacter sp. SG786]|uniref:endodeoxyribonuclease RusA n=1 Tax=Luteibacter sp. SG786 TaxID=2587130 RepID=UPI00141E9E6D|nr:endodeoxyribonuclease RusA [Luteibacter sp. SG786]NII53568.1 hypothetical protein [Luteibacter sp. SG786]